MMMKRLLYLLLMLPCIFPLVSCQKEQADPTNIEGTWRAYKGELLFNGKVIESGEAAMEDYSSISFAEGFVTFIIDGEVQRFPYTISNNIITVVAYIIPIQMIVKKLTKNDLALEIPIPTIESDFTGESVAKYDGKTIYKTDDSFFSETYWYVSGGKIVVCEPLDEDDLNGAWIDATRMYLKR